MRILITGSGGVGGYFGALLAKAKFDVTFLARGEHLKAIQNVGLRLKSINGDWKGKVNAFEKLPKDQKPFELVLICVKAHQTKEILPLIENVVDKNSLIISLQNGLNRHIPLIEKFGKECVAGGLTILGAYVESPGIICNVAAGKMVIGELNGNKTSRLENVVKKFKKAGIDIELSNEIIRRQWQKLVWNVGFNGPTALLDTSVGEVLKRDEERVLITSLMDEAIKVGSALGVSLSKDLAKNTLEYSGRELGAVIPSMVYDRRRGKPLEWEIFHGFVSKEGKRLGIPTPANDMVGTLLQAFDSHE